MIHEWLAGQLDYILLWHGLAMVLLAGIGLKLSREHDPLPWQWLSAFGLLQAMSVWLEILAMGLRDPPAFQFARTAIMAASYLPLIEFGRQGWRRRDGTVPGCWIFLPLAALAVAGCLFRAGSVNMSCRWALGLPGGLMAGWVILREARRAEPARRRPLVLTGIALLAYGAATGLIAPQACPLLDSAVSSKTFSFNAGLPAQLLRASCAVMTSLGVWLIYCTRRNMASGGRWLHLGLVLVTVAALFVGGSWFTNWRGQLADTDQRERLLSQAKAVARTIHGDTVRSLQFTLADKTDPRFQQLRSQMIAYAAAVLPSFGPETEYLSIYSMVLRDGKILFGPENIDETDSRASPPGTIYIQPPAAVQKAFQSHLPQTVGPYKDEYGTFVSAFAPVIDLRTNQVVLLVGMDIEATAWLHRIVRARLFALLLASAMILVILANIALMEWRSQLPAGKHARTRHLEVIVTSTIGLASTFLVVYLVRDNGIRSRGMVFSSLAEGRAMSVVDAMRDVRDTQLEGLGRLFDSNLHLSRNQFQACTEHLCRSGIVQAWGWVPMVTPEVRARMEDDVRREGRTDFAIWRKNARGDRMSATECDAYYPVYYVEPYASNTQALGYDLGSEPTRRAAMEEARRSGLLTATDLVTLVQKAEAQKGILVFRPVFSGRARDRLEGFALAVLRVETMLRQALAELDPDQSTAIVNLYQLDKHAPPCFLGSSSDHSTKAHESEFGLIRNSDADRTGLGIEVPLFVFGKAYAVVVHPGTRFLAAHPMRDGWVTGVIGLLLTIVFTAFIGSLSHRRAALQREVEMRTAAMEATHKANAIRQREEARGKALLQLSQMGHFTPKQIAEYALETGIQLTDSTIGYIAFASEDESTLTMAYWSNSAMAECAVIDRPIVYPVKDTGLWGEAMRQRKPVITNDYQAPSPLKKGTPPGHVKVTRHMNVPIFDKDRIVVVAGVGNKATDYTEEDVVQLRLLMDGMWAIFCRKQAEQALQEREEQYRTLVANLPIGLFRKAPGTQGQFLMANAALIRMCGYDSVEEFIQIPAQSLFVDPDELASLSDLIAAQGRLSGAPIRMKRRDGTTLWGSISAKAVRDERWNVQYLDGMVEDITARKHAEEALLESEEKHRLLFEASQDALMTLSVSSWSFTSGNPAAIRMFAARDEEDFCTKGPWDVSPECQPNGELSAPTAKKMIETALREGSCFFEWRHKTLQGEEFPATVLLTRVELRGQTLLQATVRNVAAQKQAEDALRESENRFKSISEYATDAIIMIDVKGEISFWNPAAERIFGYTPDEVMGRNLHTLLVPEQYRHDHRKAFPAFQATGQGMIIGTPLELEALRKDGTVFPVELSVSSIRRQDGFHAVGILRDITGRKGTESELRAGNAMILEALEREKKVSACLETTMQDLRETQQRLVETSRQAGMAEIATGVLHNVGNVLNSVNVSTSLIGEKLKASRLRGLHKSVAMLDQHTEDMASFLTQDEKGRQLPAFLRQLSAHLAEEHTSIKQELKTLSDNIDHIKNIVARQQDYARHSNVIEELAAAEVVKDALGLCQADLERSDIELVREYSTVPMIRADRHKVLQILVNLLRNAQQAMKDPEASRKRVTLRILNGSEGQVRIEVADTGTGIHPEHLPMLFTHGFTTKVGGHGFGLHNSALAANEMGGTLTAQSEGIGHGATFTLGLPAANSEVVQ